MGLDMSWDEWCKEYPAEEVNTKPEFPEDNTEYKDQVEAEVCRDKLEEQYEICFKVVKFNDKFFIVH